jgi:hypothetical protein
MRLLIVTLLSFLAIAAAWRGVRLLVKGIAEADHPSGPTQVVRGLRGLAVAVGLGALCGGVLLAHPGLVAFGAIFLAEEIYETGFLLLILRAGRLTADPARPAPRGTPCI